MGTPLFPAQKFILDVALEVDVMSGTWVYEDVTVAMQRRAGKTHLLRPLVAHRAAMTDAMQIWLTAQKREKAVERWAEVKNALENVMREELYIRISNGHEIVRWENMSTFRPFAPDEDTMHGEGPDLVIVDELWSFDAREKSLIEQGYIPAWSVKSGQVWKLSAAGTDRSDWLIEETARGRAACDAGVTTGTAYFEWSIPAVVDGEPVSRLDDEALVELVLAHHPRRDHGLRVNYLEQQLQKWGRAEFLRAFGGVPMARTDDLLVPLDVWELAAARSILIPEGEPIVLGVAVEPYGRESAIVAGWRSPEDGKARVEVLDKAAGTRWLAKRVEDLRAAWNVLQVATLSVGPIRGIIDDGLKVPQADWPAACSAFLSGIHEVDERNRPTGRPPLILHDGRRGPELTDAMTAADVQRGRHGLTFTPRGKEPISVLDAATLALWALNHLPESERPEAYSWGAY